MREIFQVQTQRTDGPNTTLPRIGGVEKQIPKTPQLAVDSRGLTSAGLFCTGGW
ncbi:hypothetical protein BaRGS_00027945, partial [Batillaria attramentaria]